MSEKIKIYTAQNGDNYILWNHRLVELVEEPRKLDHNGMKTFPDHYSICTDTSQIDYLSEAERDAAYDELTALLEQARKQLAERDAKKAEIEAARELLKDGKRVDVINIKGSNYIIFRDQLIQISGTTVGYIESGGAGFHRFYANGRGFYYYTHKKAERMWAKLTDHLARAKAQLLLEEVGE